MSAPNVFVKVGTTMARVRPENRERIEAALVKASKIPTAKQARANALRGGVSRKYPKFTEGMCAADYVRQFTMLNARQTGGGIRSGPFLSMYDIKREEEAMAAFFQPLSVAPQFAQSGEVIEEVMA